jgi:hypothetical protein
MRKQFCVYTKGFPGGAALREKAVHAQTIEEYRNIVANYNDREVDHSQFYPYS